MRRVIGPIMTTGVALVVAGVVVANPIAAPRSDIQIAEVQLSAGVDSAGAGMLDAAFLNAIGPKPPESTSPLSVFKELIASLAADVSHFGKSVIFNAFIAGVAAVSQPELTAASTPYLGPTVDLGDLPGGGSDLPSPGSMPVATAVPGLGAVVPATAVAADDPFAVSADPAVHAAVVAALAADAYFLGGQVVAAVVATGVVVASEPAMIAATLRALVAGDVQSALASAAEAVAAPLRPPAMVFDAVQTVLSGHLTQFLAATSTSSNSAPGVLLKSARALVAERAHRANTDDLGGSAGMGRMPGSAAAVKPISHVAENSVARSEPMSATPNVAAAPRAARSANSAAEPRSRAQRPTRQGRGGVGA